MSSRLLLLLSVALLTANYGGGGKHLPSSNPPEYDPKKVYASPAPAPPARPADTTASLARTCLTHVKRNHLDGPNPRSCTAEYLDAMRDRLSEKEVLVVDLEVGVAAVEVGARDQRVQLQSTGRMPLNSSRTSFRAR